jgi:DeoR/GlpR family transcriptional regulator of sugar metabolism
MTERQKSILELIIKSSGLSVAKLSVLLGVSRVTIRKDLDFLVGKSLIRHERGLALPGSNDDISNRLAYHYDKKRKIAEAAAAFVKDGETLMIESGSCCAILAEELLSKRKGITIITNSAFIATYIRRLPLSNIILLGGDYQNESQVMVGPLVRKCVEGFFVDKFFIGLDGFSETSGFMGGNHLRAETVRDMAKQASHIVILTESEKFSNQGLVPLLPVPSVSKLITDDAIPAETERLLTEQHVAIYKA